MTKVRIKQIPKQQPAGQGITPFSNPFADQPKMAYGGAKPGMGNMNNGANGQPPIQTIDNRWDWMRGVQDSGNSPYNSINKTLPEVPAHMADINAEKQEQVMGDFGGDGMPVLMGVNGPSHADGGKNLQVPSNSFVFSDTKNLMIKDPVLLKQFGATKPMTPALLAKKYDLASYKSVIDDSQAEDIEKRTAILNYTNAIQKLNALSTAQEQMKARKGLPNDLGNQKYGGPAPTYATGGPWDIPEHSTPDIPFTAPFDATVTANRLYPQAGTPTGPYMMPTDTQPQQMSPVAVPNLPFNHLSDTGAISDVGKSKSRTGSGTGTAGLNPDQMRNYLWALRATSYPNYQPTRQIAHGATPQAVFMDPTRAKAAYTEQANQAANNAALSGNGAIARANSMDVSGKAGAGAANIEGEYNNKNVEIANRANQEAAQIYTNVANQQQGYNKEYSDEVANMLKDRYGFNTSMANEYLKGQYEDRARKQQAHNSNYINPYYTFDEQGFVHPKSAEQLKAVQTLGNYPGSGTGTGNEFTSYAAALQAAKSTLPGGTPEEIKDMMHHIMNQREKASYDAMGRLKGFTNSGYADEEGRPAMYKKFGGDTGKTKMRITALPKS